MTINEFKAWLDGFEQAMGDSPPNAEQWKAIKAKLAKVEAVRPTTYHDALPRGWNDAIRMAEDEPLRPLIARY